MKMCFTAEMESAKRIQLCNERTDQNQKRNLRCEVNSNYEQ